MASCEHEPRTEKVCAHLLQSELSHRVRFTGRGRASELVCEACTDSRELVDVCAACHAAAANGGDWTGIIGEPEILVAPSSLAFGHEDVAVDLPDVLDVQPLLGGDRARFAHDRTFDELPVLGDALQVAGCTDAELLAHCREPGEHAAHCWALDRLIGAN